MGVSIEEAFMCRAVQCKTCGKTTWAGCGQHVDQVMAGVPKNQRCTCDRAAASKPSSNPLAAMFGGRGRRR